MTTVGVTGVRNLTRADEYKLRPEMREMLKTASNLHVGDADGVDAIAHELGLKLGLNCTLHHTDGRQPWQLQKRSKQMVDALAKLGGTLHAYPNKNCPDGVTPVSWKGSGTWGTMCYAQSKGVKVELHPLVEVKSPDWLTTEQLALW